MEYANTSKNTTSKIVKKVVLKHGDIFDYFKHNTSDLEMSEGKKGNETTIPT